MSAPADKAPDKTLLPDRAPADMPATTTPTARSPFGVDKTPTDKPAMSAKPAPSDKSPASTKPAPTEKSATAEKKDTRMAAAAPETGGSGAVVEAGLRVRDAVARSKDLAVEGFKVQVRRAGGAAPAPRVTQARPRPPAANGGETFYRVRVGAFPDRATAMTTLK